MPWHGFWIGHSNVYGLYLVLITARERKQQTAPMPRPWKVMEGDNRCPHILALLLFSRILEIVKDVGPHGVLLYVPSLLVL